MGKDVRAKTERMVNVHSSSLSHTGSLVTAFTLTCMVHGAKEAEKGLRPFLLHFFCRKRTLFLLRQQHTNVGKRGERGREFEEIRGECMRVIFRGQKEVQKEQRHNTS